MVITEVKIKLMEGNNERVQAFASVTFNDAFVVRDLKIIEGEKGSFVSMPSRKLTDRCSGCGTKNHLRARFCNYCGDPLDPNRAIRDSDGHAKLHADVAHPINADCREIIAKAVLCAFEREKRAARHPNYRCSYDYVTVYTANDRVEDQIFETPPLKQSERPKELVHSFGDGIL